MENAQRKRCSQLPIESRGSVFTLVPTFWLESVLEKSDTVPQNSPADLTTVKAILKDCVVTKKDFILIKKLWTCSAIFGRFLCSQHTTIVVKLDRNGNPIPVAVGSSNQCSLLQSYIVDNYSVNQCNETNRVHLFACLIETFNSCDILVNLRNRTGEKRRRQTLCDKRDNNFVWNNFSPKFTFL